MQPTYSPRKLYRSSRESMLGGVCGGLAQYLGADVTLVRIFFVLVALAAGTGLLLYLALWIIVPLDGQETAREGGLGTGNRFESSDRPGNRQGGAVTGWLLLAVGMMFLVQNLAGEWLPWLGFGSLWPLLLIFGGGALLVRRAKGA